MHYVIKVHVPDLRIGEQSESLPCKGWRRRAIYAYLISKSHITYHKHAKKFTSSLSAFVISKTHTSEQKPQGTQLNAKVCGSESAIFLILALATTTTFDNDISPTVEVLTVILA